MRGVADLIPRFDDTSIRCPHIDATPEVFAVGIPREACEKKGSELGLRVLTTCELDQLVGSIEPCIPVLPVRLLLDGLLVCEVRTLH